MFCPSCRDEFRPGFTRCEACGVDLVDSVEGEARPSPEPAARREVATVAHLVDYCGFVSLDEARQAREQLRSKDIRTEIVIRDGPGANHETDPAEEYWLRVDRARVPDVHAVLGFDEAGEGTEEAGFLCDACGADVGADETACPRCGARFEEG